jgi:hypothetical protein
MNIHDKYEGYWLASCIDVRARARSAGPFRIKLHVFWLHVSHSFIFGISN